MFKGSMPALVTPFRNGELDLEALKRLVEWQIGEGSTGLVPVGTTGESPGDYARAFARLENHYFINDGFLEFDGQILANMGRISHIPGHIVQGRYDMICPPNSAWKLSELWPNADLRMIRNAGHALSEPGISAELVRIMDAIAEEVTA